MPATDSSNCHFLCMEPHKKRQFNSPLWPALCGQRRMSMNDIESIRESAKEAVQENRFDDAARLYQEAILANERLSDPMKLYSANMEMSLFLESIVEDDLRSEPFRAAAVSIIKQTGGYGASEVAENIRCLSDLKSRLGKVDEATLLMNEADMLDPRNTQQEQAK